MEIRANSLNPKVTLEDVDVYLPRGIKALEVAGKNPRGLFRIFQRYEGASFFGRQEFLSALSSTMSEEEKAQTVVWAMPEGYKLAKHEAAMYIEGPAKALMINETLLHFLTTGTRFRTLAADYPGSKYPWVFMGARYLAGDDLAIATRALSEEGILSTVPRWAERFIGTESHSQIAMWGGLRLSDEVEALISNETKDERVAATIRATIAFHLANPEVPLYVLGDFAARSTGCFEVFRATAADCAKLGIPLVGGRMDISKADLNDEPLVEPTVKPEYEKALAEAERQFKEACKQGYMDPGEQYLSALQDVKRKYAGMNLSVVRKVREQLDEAGLKEFKLVISSGIKLEAIDDYVEAGANLVGIGEEAAYYLNKGECNFTSDAVGFIENGRLTPFAKEGRELSRVVEESVLDNFKPGDRLSENMERIDLSQFKEVE